MSSIEITKTAEGYLKELLEKQDTNTIGIKVFVNEPGSPRAETCIAYCKEDDDLSEFDLRKDLSFKLYLEKKSLSAAFPEATLNICNEINKLII